MKRVLVVFNLLLFAVVLQAKSADADRDQVNTADLIKRVARQTAEVRKQSNALNARLKAKAESDRKRAEDGPYSVASKNFVVGAPSRTLAVAVLKKAETLRKQIAHTWLGKEFPKGQEFTLIRVFLSHDVDEGLTLLAGSGREIQGSHRMWLETTAELATGSTLAHEITHVVLSSRFPEGMPAWANEGIASLADDNGRAKRRSEILRHFAENNRWPSVAEILDTRAIDPTDESGYALAVSLTKFLLSRADHAAFIQFVERGSLNGWDKALKDSFGIDGATALQKQWQTWVRQRPQPK